MKKSLPLAALFFPVVLIAGILRCPARANANGSVDASSAPAHPALRLLSDDELPDFTETYKSRAGLIKASQKALNYLKHGNTPRYFKIADRQYAPGALIASLEEFILLAKSASTKEAFAAGIKESFDVFQSLGSDGKGRVVYSSYYQPMMAASRKKSLSYPYPLYKQPSDLVEVQLGAFDKKYGEETLIGRVDKYKHVVPYFTRNEIDFKKSLANRGLELAWIKTKLEVLDLQVQGSGILRFPSGQEVLARYAATNNHPYNSIGMMLVKTGVLAKDEISYDKVRDYLHSHPEAEDFVLEQNPRYTFFKLETLPADGEPFGSAQESLVPQRAVALDPSIMPLGSILFMTTTAPRADREGHLFGQFPSRRFALGMDTGGAIKGPGRIDIYAGHGLKSETEARNQWAEGKLYVLIKKL
jgi:membrane-bound lytic murein transglycosylase A